MHDIQGKGITKIVGYGQVEDLTREGWKVIGMFQECSTDSQWEQVPDPTQGWSGAEKSLQRYYPSTDTYFILELDEDSSLTHMNSTIERQKNRLEELEKSDQEQKKGIEKLEKSLETMRGKYEHYEEVYNEERNKRIDAENTKRKMETDIGKIEKAIGTQKMKEILAEEK